MMTLDSIRNVEFTKGRGYRADEVDDFIDACTETVEQLFRERDELNQKMKLLADKLVEYRNEEDSIRSALLNAQRTGDTVIREAEQKAAQVREEAQREADSMRAAALNQIEAEKLELDRVQREVAAFKARMLGLYKEHLALIQVLPESEPEAPAPETEEKSEPAEPAGDVVVTPPTEEPAAPVENEAEMKPLSRFANLKFGNDYDIYADTEDDEPSSGTHSKRK